MLHVAIYVVVLLASLGAFAYLLYRRLGALKQARSYDARGGAAERLKGVLLNVLGQGRLLHGDLNAGVMHCVIFWGFVFLLLNSLHFLINGFVPAGGPELALPFFARSQPLGIAYLWVRDIFDVLVLLAVCYALLRRLVIKPKRIKLSFEGNLILIFIALLMVTDLTMSGATLMLGQIDPPYSPAEQLVGNLLAGADPRGIVWLNGVSWWVHLLTLVSFLNLLPVSKHFHILTSVPKVYLRNLKQQGRPRRIDFEAEEEYGVSRIEQLSWSNWLDSYSCTECGRCDFYCPAKQTGKLLSPQHIVTGTREEIYAGPARTALPFGRKPGAPAAPKELAGQVHLDQELWACTTCGACDTHCPLFIEHVEPILEMRRHLVLELEGRFPKELQATFRGLETQGNPFGIGAHRRMEWAEGLDVPTLEDNPGAEWLYFVGCFASFDDRSKPAARAFVQLLQHAGVSFAVLPQETCCGDPARRCGHEYLAQASIELNVEQLKAMQPRKVVSACPHCYNTLKNEYRDFGVEFEEVLHHSELLLRLVREGRLKPQRAARGRDGEGRTVYHDSCYLGRYNGIYSAPRELLAAVPSTPPAEAHYYNRDKGFCCGAGGGNIFMEEMEGERVQHFRYRQLAATGAERVAVACPFCMTMLDDAAKEPGAKTLPVVDIAVLLRDAVLGS